MSNAKAKGKMKVARRATPVVGGPCHSGVIDDPRLGPGFVPAHFPLCDGGAAPPPGTTDRIERRQIEFLAAYYRLNRLCARLQAIRLGATGEDEQSVLREIQDAIHDRDVLEDSYAPEGFLAEPVMEGVCYGNIEFTHARSRQFYQPPVSSRFSLSIGLPPPGVDVEDWVQGQLIGVFPEPADGPPDSLDLERRPSRRRPKKPAGKPATPEQRAKLKSTGAHSAKPPNPKGHGRR